MDVQFLVKKLQEKVIIWPTYFDQNRSRSEGRKVPRSLAVGNPKLTEVEAAALELGCSLESRSDASYPSAWWQKSGYLVVEKTAPKAGLLKALGSKLQQRRSREQQQKKP